MWDPQTYLAFADERSRPFFDLLARVGADAPRRVVDAGCGAGNLTKHLAARWPGAVIEAFDTSPEMVERARANGIPATVSDVREWEPSPDSDVVVSNAVLHWVPEHPLLLARWAPALPQKAWFALQVPWNGAAPSHRAIVEVIGRPHWRDRLAQVDLGRPGAVLDPAGYARIFAAAGWTVDAWETTYLHVLTGDDPVLTWVSGTTLTPVRSALDGEAWTTFCSELAPLLRAAYPRQPDGTTWFPFRRVFAVAHRH